MRRVEPDAFVALPPALDDDTGLGKGGEDLPVHVLVAQLAVKALAEAVLLRFARAILEPVDAGTVGPFQHGAGA